MKEVITYTDYEQYKTAMDDQWRRNAEKAGELVEGFAIIGYLLKQARDTDILKNSGYKNVDEFAEAEYHIDKSVVSRYIGINDRFAEMGNSKKLKEHYRGIGYAKLILMLQMPDGINEEITPAFSKAEVQDIKAEMDEERRRTELEVLMEGEDERQQAMEDNLKKVVHQLGRDNPELYVKLHVVLKEGRKIEAVYELLAPAGESIYSVRIQGVGRLMLSVKGTDRDVALFNSRTNEKEFYSWIRLTGDLDQLMDFEKEAEESWAETYGEEYPKAKEAEVAPVQPEKNEKKPAPRKQSKVTPAKTVLPRSRPAPVEEPEEVPKEESEQVEEVAPVKPEKEEPEKERREEEMTPAAAEEDVLYGLRKEAEEYMEKVREALNDNQYFLARIETKHLLETIEEIVATLEKKQMPGQMEMGM